MVSGRRRQGKTFLLDAACRAEGGFYFGATEAADAESLRRISTALTAHVRPASPYHFAHWAEAVDALLALGSERPVPVVIDEFPYLVRANPELPSIIQEAFRPLREQRTASRARLLLCGSALSFMGKLLSGNAPLRGRAGLELVVRPRDHRLAAEFWNITDPRLALQVNAIVGGTPAYRREFARGDSPDGPDDFDAWVVRTVLNPETPLFREARYLLAEEPDLRDTALYLSVLAAVADGNATRGSMAGYLERKATDIAHPINVLEDAGLLHRDADAFRDNRPTYRIAEPLIGFYHAIMRPVWDQLERPGSATRVWQASRRRFTSNVLGPTSNRSAATGPSTTPTPTRSAASQPESATASSMTRKPAPGTRSMWRPSASRTAASRRCWPSEKPSGTTPWASRTSIASGTSATSSPRPDATTPPVLSSSAPAGRASTTRPASPPPPPESS